MSIATWHSFSMPHVDSTNCSSMLLGTMFWRACLMWRHHSGFGRGMQWQQRPHLLPPVVGESPTLIWSSVRISRKADHSITTNNICDRTKTISLITKYLDTIWFLTYEGKRIIL